MALNDQDDQQDKADRYGALRALRSLLRRSEVEHAGDALYAHAVLEPAKLALGMLADLLDCMPAEADMTRMMVLLHGDMVIDEGRETMKARRLRECYTRMHTVLHAVRNYHLTMDFDRVALAEAMLGEAVAKCAGVIDTTGMKATRGDETSYVAIGASVELPACNLRFDLRFDLFDEHWALTADRIEGAGDESMLSRNMGAMLSDADLHVVASFILHAHRLVKTESSVRMAEKGLRLVQSG